jgi:hypothetical protein
MKQSLILAISIVDSIVFRFWGITKNPINTIGLIFDITANAVTIVTILENDTYNMTYVVQFKASAANMHQGLIVPIYKVG